MSTNLIIKTMTALVVSQAVMSAPAFADSSPQSIQTVGAPDPASKLTVSGIDHVGMNVPNVKEAVTFFEQLLGAKIVSDMNPGKIPDAWKDKFRWHRSSDLHRIVMMQMQDGTKIELFEYSGPQISHTMPHEDDAAATHVALRATDIAHSVAVLKKMNLRILNDPITLPDGETWFYFLTPWGSQIELVFAPQSK